MSTFSKFSKNVVWMAVIIAAGISCSKTNKQASSFAQEVPDDFSIQFGEGGGFTGMWQGYTIKANGDILSWQGRTYGENPESVGTLSQEDVQTIWREVQQASFFSQTLSETGNMTAIMRVTANDKRHEVSWAATAAQAQQAVALINLREQCRKMVEKATDQR